MSGRHPFSSALFVIGALLGISGCASFSADGGFDRIADTAQTQLNKEAVWARTPEQARQLESRVQALLDKPLSVDDAVQVALFNNKGLQAAFAQLQISEADWVQAGRLPNPTFSMLRASKQVADGLGYKIEQSLTFNIFFLITRPLAQAAEQRNFENTQRQVAQHMLTVASQTRKAYYSVLAARETARYMQQVRTAAEAGAQLGQRMAQAGNWSKLQQAREQGFYADAVLGQSRADLSYQMALEKLIRLLGVWGPQTTIQLPERLPDLPAQVQDLPRIEEAALAQRLDVQAARLHTMAVANNLGLSKATRFINVLEVGPARVLEGPRNDGFKTGYTVSLELPIFDFGSAKVAKAEALYMQSVYTTAQTALQARSEVRQAYLSYRSTYDMARHYRDEVVPLSKRISEENQLRYNGMLIGVFDLLADARTQIASVNNYIDALRDFWMAQADLEMAMIGKIEP